MQGPDAYPLNGAPAAQLAALERCWRTLGYTTGSRACLIRTFNSLEEAPRRRNTLSGQKDRYGRIATDLSCWPAPSVPPPTPDIPAACTKVAFGLGADIRQGRFKGLGIGGRPPDAQTTA